MNKNTPAKRRKIVHSDIEEIAKLLAKRMTEKEAALVLGIEPRVWYRFRERHENQEEFDAILTRTRGEYIRANLREMEKAAGGKGGVRHDWRAADRLNAIVSPERYGQQQQPPDAPVHPNAVNPSVVNVWIDLAKAQIAQEKAAVVDAQEVKALPAPSETTPAEGDGWTDVVLGLSPQERIEAGRRLAEGMAAAPPPPLPPSKKAVAPLPGWWKSKPEARKSPTPNTPNSTGGK